MLNPAEAIFPFQIPVPKVPKTHTDVVLVPEKSAKLHTSFSANHLCGTGSVHKLRSITGISEIGISTLHSYSSDKTGTFSPETA